MRRTGPLEFVLQPYPAQSLTPAQRRGQLIAVSDTGKTVQANVLSGELPDAARARVDEMFREHSAFVWRCLLRLGVPESAAEDAIQEVFLVVYRRIDQVRPDSQVRAWLFSIARRVASHARRRQTRNARKLGALAAVDPPTPVGPEHQVVANEAVEIVERFLGALEEDQRTVFYLAEIEQLTAPEISAALGVKLNTVYSRLRLARKKFQTLLADEVPDA